jgi:hypothetical protein
LTDVKDLAAKFETTKVKSLPELEEIAETVSTQVDAQKGKAALARLWKHCLVHLNPDDWQPPVSSTEVGQIWHLKNALPDGTIGTFIIYVVTRWESARMYLVENQGWVKTKLPAEPTPGLVLSQKKPLVQWFLAEISSPEATEGFSGGFVDG